MNDFIMLHSLLNQLEFEQQYFGKFLLPKKLYRTVQVDLPTLHTLLNSSYSYLVIQLTNTVTKCEISGMQFSVPFNHITNSPWPAIRKNYIIDRKSKIFKVLSSQICTIELIWLNSFTYTTALIWKVICLWLFITVFGRAMYRKTNWLFEVMKQIYKPKTYNGVWILWHVTYILCDHVHYDQLL